MYSTEAIHVVIHQSIHPSIHAMLLRYLPRRPNLKKK